MLFEERAQKINLKQKTTNLIIRTQNLMKITPLSKKSVIKKLGLILYQLNQELTLLELEIAHREEDMVRKGCPGILL